MPGTHKIVMDEFCEVKELLAHTGLITDWFWDLDQHEIIPGAVYVFSRQQFAKQVRKIKELAKNNIIFPVLGNPAEGSETMLNQAAALGILDLVKQQKIAIIAGGSIQSDVPVLFYENFLPKILNYQENVSAAEQYSKTWTDKRPYKFLCLNGRARSHRRALLKRLSHLLDSCVWTNLDATHGNELKLLPPEYEFDFYQKNISLEHTGFAKYSLFGNDWGEIYLNPRPYSDTYFSLVTETVFDYPHSFRTEKIWKPIAIAHPWIAVANRGYYRDMHNLGFQTFGHLIDESFDLIDNSADRLERIARVVEDLCTQDLADFAKECYTVCKYNQSLLAELTVQIPRAFPVQFQKYINERFRIQT